MKSVLIKASLLAVLALHWTPLRADDSKPVPYEPSVATLSGTIVEEDYGDDSSPIDRGKHAWILRLDRPIFVPAKSGDEINTEEKNVTEVYLNVDQAKHPMPKGASGRTRFTATGTLYHGHNTHHLRPIVMFVSDLKPSQAIAGAEDLFANPLMLFREAMVPALTKSERGKVETTWRGFNLRADRQSEFNRENKPSVDGIYLDVEVRDAVEIPKHMDSVEKSEGMTKRTVKFPPVGENRDQGLIVIFLYGDDADAESIKSIDQCIADIQRKAEPAVADQPATKPADNASVEEQPSPSEPKDGTR